MMRAFYSPAHPSAETVQGDEKRQRKRWESRRIFLY
jgi:hypothetical protein